MDLELSGQGAVVFGGAQGIGRAIAKAFVEEGCPVGIFDLSQEVQEVATDLGESCCGISGDVTDSQVVTSAAEEFIRRLGGVRHVVFAVGAGSGIGGFPFWNLQPSDWPRILEINLVGAVNVAHAFAPTLTEQNRGTVLFLTSVAGQIGSQTDPPYSAAKAGLINFMQCAAKDFAPFGVRANCLSPGMVKTGLNESVWRAVQETLPKAERMSYSEWADEKIRSIAPLGKWQKPEEFGSMAVYLASEKAQNITGQVINIDGGQVMHA